MMMTGQAFMHLAATNRIKINTVANNNAPYAGGGMSISGGRNNISNNNFFSNTSGVSGGGMYFSDAVCTVTENNIYSNSSDKGGGIAASGGKKQPEQKSNIVKQQCYFRRCCKNYFRC